jgi:hypothetical protein
MDSRSFIKAGTWRHINHNEDHIKHIDIFKAVEMRFWLSCFKKKELLVVSKTPNRKACTKGCHVQTEIKFRSS